MYALHYDLVRSIQAERLAEAEQQRLVLAAKRQAKSARTSWFRRFLRRPEPTYRRPQTEVAVPAAAKLSGTEGYPARSAISRSEMADYPVAAT